VLFESNISDKAERNSYEDGCVRSYDSQNPSWSNALKPARKPRAR
jgi:hypothetical protein